MQIISNLRRGRSTDAENINLPIYKSIWTASKSDLDIASLSLNVVDSDLMLEGYVRES